MKQILFLNVDGSDLPDRIKEIQEAIRDSEYGLSAIDLHRSRNAVRQTSENIMHLQL